MKKILTLLLIVISSLSCGQRDTVSVIILACDTSDWSGNKINALGQVYWIKGYSVREKHNEAEGLIDPYFCGNCVYEDYWKHLYYIAPNKKVFPSSIIIWMSKEIK